MDRELREMTHRGELDLLAELLQRLLNSPPPGVDVDEMMAEIASKGAEQFIREHGVDPDNIELNLDRIEAQVKHFEDAYGNPPPDGQ